MKGLPMELHANTITIKRLVVLMVFSSLVVGGAVTSAQASAWSPVDDVSGDTFNPCTTQETSLSLHDVELLISGPGGSHEGFKFKGQFATGDGFHGSFHDLDQGNTVPNADTDNVFTQLVLFRGTNDAHQRVIFTSVLHVVIRDGEPVNIVTVGDGRCVGAPAT